MKFKKNSDGSWQLIFSNKEIEILNKQKKLIFTSIGFRHFGNNLMNLCVDLLQQQKDKDKFIQTDSKEIKLNDKS